MTSSLKPAQNLVETLDRYLSRSQSEFATVNIPLVEALLVAVGTLHKKGYYHGDLRPTNIVIDPTDLKVTLINPNDNVDNQPSEAKAYLAPEVKDTIENGKAVDCWALGCIIYEVMTGKKFITGKTKPTPTSGRVMDLVLAIGDKADCHDAVLEFSEDFVNKNGGYIMGWMALVFTPPERRHIISIIDIRDANRFMAMD